MKAMIISVGGTTEPIVKSLLTHRPEYVCLFASQQSLDTIGDIKRQVRENGHSFEDYKVVCDDVNDLVHCYEKALECAERLSALDADQVEIIVDYTGGTKTMTAALALATVGHGYNFSYVGGEKRTKNGLGIVVTGTEVVTTGVSPWQIFAVEERKRISLFISTFQYEAAISTMRQTLDKLKTDEREIWSAILETLDGYRAWDNFALREALKRLSSGIKKLELCGKFCREKPIKEYLDKVKNNFDVLDAINQSTKFFTTLHPILVRDIVSNARRRYLQNKYDDAVARLYRALEMTGQIAFENETGCSTSDVSAEKLPLALREEYMHQYISTLDQKLKIPLFATYRVLEELNNPVGQKFAMHREDLKNLLAARNSSILAHGVVPIAGETYEKFEGIITNLFVEGPLIEFPRLEW